MANFTASVHDRMSASEKEEKTQFFKQEYDMKMTVDNFFSNRLEKYLLGNIIYQDNLKMFRIYTCNTIDDDINTHRVPRRNSKPILFMVITASAIKIANYLLARVNIVVNVDDDHKKNEITNDNYHFPKIDIGQGSSSNQDTPLTRAAYFKDVEIVSLLLNHPNMTKNGINKCNKYGQTPLHCAAMNVRDVRHTATDEDVEKTAQMLINDERTDLNCHDIKYGQTPLMYAMRMQARVAQLLIDNENVDVNAKSTHGHDDGGTALHIGIQTMKDNACKDTSEYDTICQVIKKLLSRKDFDKNIRNGKGKTGLDMAKKAKFSKIVKML